MSSPVTTVIKLDPFYQQFLRVQLNQHNSVFEFPKGHDLCIFLQFSLTKAPDDFTPTDYGSETFEVAIPYMEHKNPYVYNYISVRANGFLATRICEYQRSIFHAEIGERKRKGFYKDEIIWQLIEEFQFPEEYYDRIAREYTRYQNSERQRRYLHKNQRQKNKKNVSVA